MARNKNLEYLVFEKMAKRTSSKEKHRRKKTKGWVVKNDRPEEYLASPQLYYTDDTVDRYARSGGMRRAQEKIAYRVLELLDIEPGASLLDLGSGPGFTANIYRNEGYDVTCLDVMDNMVCKAKENGFDAYTGDMRDAGEIFSGRKFDAVVSVSALQWLTDKCEIEKAARGIYSVLDTGSSAVIQFYPKSEQKLDEAANAFVKSGFSGEIITDCPDVPKNRTVYLVMKKS